jgi:hypothetical protein
MTLALGFMTKDLAVLITDSRGVGPNGSGADGVPKIIKCARNCAVAIAGDGEVAVNILGGMGFLDSDEECDPLTRAEEIANGFRAYVLGEPDPAKWRTGRYERAALVGRNWVHGAPSLECIVAGHSARGSYVSTLIQEQGFAVHPPLRGTACAGQITIAFWILQKFIPSEFWTVSPEFSTLVGTLAILLTSEAQPWYVNFDPAICWIDASGVRMLKRESVSAYKDTALEIRQALGSAIEKCRQTLPSTQLEPGSP